MKKSSSKIPPPLIEKKKWWHLVVHTKLFTSRRVSSPAERVHECSRVGQLAQDHRIRRSALHEESDEPLETVLVGRVETNKIEGAASDGDRCRCSELLEVIFDTRRIRVVE